MRAIHLLAALPFVAYALVADTSVEGYAKAMQATQSIRARLSVSKVGGSTEEQTLSLSRPNLLKWESDGKLIVSDGKTLWTYDKAAKTYTKTEATEASIVKAMGQDLTWAWSAFFDKDFLAGVAASQQGSARTVRKMSVTDLTITRKDKRVFTLPLLNDSGIAVGARYTDPSGETIILAKDITVGANALDASQYAWTPPADAKDAAEAAANAMPFSDVKAIFDASCAGCHGGPNPKAGVNLSSYEGIMESRTVRPGNSKSSKLIRIIESGKMPPAGPLPAETIAKLAKWIDDGAKS